MKRPLDTPIQPYYAEGGTVEPVVPAYEVLSRRMESGTLHPRAEQALNYAYHALNTIARKRDYLDTLKGPSAGEITREFPPTPWPASVAHGPGPESPRGTLFTGRAVIPSEDHTGEPFMGPIVPFRPYAGGGSVDPINQDSKQNLEAFHPSEPPQETRNGSSLNDQMTNIEDVLRELEFYKTQQHSRNEAMQYPSFEQRWRYLGEKYRRLPAEIMGPEPEGQTPVLDGRATTFPQYAPPPVPRGWR